MMRPVTTDTVLRPAVAPGVPLAQLVPGASGVLTGVALDSRQVRPGDLYVGLPGAATHGARFAAQAQASGALALLTDAAGTARKSRASRRATAALCLPRGQTGSSARCIQRLIT